MPCVEVAVEAGEVARGDLEPDAVARRERAAPGPRGRCRAAPARRARAAPSAAWSIRGSARGRFRRRGWRRSRPAPTSTSFAVKSVSTAEELTHSSTEIGPFSSSGWVSVGRGVAEHVGAFLDARLVLDPSAHDRRHQRLSADCRHRIERVVDVRIRWLAVGRRGVATRTPSPRREFAPPPECRYSAQLARAAVATLGPRATRRRRAASSGRRRRGRCPCPSPTDRTSRAAAAPRRPRRRRPSVRTRPRPSGWWRKGRRSSRAPTGRSAAGGASARLGRALGHLAVEVQVRLEEVVVPARDR